MERALFCRDWVASSFRGLLALGAVIPFLVHADSYDDCVLNGMKGVSNDIAARAVLKACESKRAQAAEVALTARYGPLLDPPKYFVTILGVPPSAKWMPIELTNKSGSTFTFVSLEVRSPAYSQPACDRYARILQNLPAPAEPCQRTFDYELHLPPGKSVVLHYPAPSGQSFVLAAVRGRDASLTDRLLPRSTEGIYPTSR